MGNENVKKMQRSKEYPAYGLGEVIDYIKQIGSYPPGTPLSYDDAASVIGVKATTNSFKYLTSSAKQFGFLTTDGKNIILSDITKKVVYPTGDISDLLIEIFKTPKMYNHLINLYKNKELPSQVILENVLVNYGIAPVVKKVAATAFIKSATFVGAIENNILLGDTIQKPQSNLDNSPMSLNEETQDLKSVKDNTGNLNRNLLQGDFGAPLIIPFGDERKAILQMPLNATKEDAEYVLDMIKLSFKRNYKIE